jgi:hypothetical protein
MRWLILVLLVAGFVSGVEVDFDCPEEVFVDEEFVCELEVFDGSGVYDVKVEIDNERNSVLKIWDSDENKWLSGYYYLKEFVRDEESVRLKVLEEGDYDGFLKLRQGDRRDFFEIEMEVSEADGDSSEMGGSSLRDGELAARDEIVVLNNVPEVISLNGNVVSEDVEKVAYVSKDARVVSYLPYVFSLFLIFVIIVLFWEKGSILHEEEY